MPKLASALTHAHVLKHQSKAIIAHISSSTSEVFRIFAPEQPYEKEETLQTVYENFNQTLGWLKYAALARGRGGEEEEDEDEDEDDEDEKEDGKKSKKKNNNNKNKKGKLSKNAASTSATNASSNVEKKRVLFAQSERLLRNIAQYGLCVPILDLEDKATSVDLARSLFETLFDATTAKTEPIIGENVARVLNTMIEEAAEDTTVTDGNNTGNAHYNKSLFHDEVLEH